MHKKIKISTLISCICFLCIMAVMLYRTSKLLEDKNSIKKYTPFFQSETDFDVIFMGTSHMYNGVLPQELWEQYGITSYNWGYANCTLADDYYLIQETLKYASPKLFVIDLFGIIEYERFGNGKYRDDSMEQQRVQFDALPLSFVKYRAVEDIFDNYDKRLDFLLNFLVYHNRWENLSQEDFQPELSVEKGAQLLAGVGEGTDYFPVDAYELVEITSACSGYVQKIVDLCDEKNVSLLFVYAASPTYEEAINCSRTLETYMEDYDVPYLNAIYIDAINGTTDFYTDNGHLNYSGQKKFTAYLGDYIRQNYDLADHRGAEAYVSWERSHEEYLEYKKKVLTEQTDINTKLMLTYGQDFHVTIQVDTSSELYDNWTFQMFIWNLGETADVQFVDGLKAGEESCQMICTFCDIRTGEAFEVCTFP